jgi:hypothetical protein
MLQRITNANNNIMSHFESFRLTWNRFDEATRSHMERDSGGRREVTPQLAAVLFAQREAWANARGVKESLFCR